MSCEALVSLWQRTWSYHSTHWVGSLLHWQFFDLGAFMVVIVVADVEGGEEVGKQAQDVDDGQPVGGIGLPGKIKPKYDTDCTTQS